MALTRTCKTCGPRPIEEFYKHPKMKDGLLNSCKACVRNRVTQHRNRNIDQVRAYDRKRAKQPHRHQHILDVSRRYREDGRHAISSKAYNERYPEKYAAKTALNNALRDGRIIKQPCKCCGTTRNVQGHHPDYSRPLDVLWLCVPCHEREHHRTEMYGRFLYFLATRKSIPWLDLWILAQ